MPQTGIKGATAFAERLRRAIEIMDIPFDDNSLNITVSAGVATYTAGSNSMTINEFIDTADKALYEAKNSGRNKVVVAGSQPE